MMVDPGQTRLEAAERAMNGQRVWIMAEAMIPIEMCVWARVGDGALVRDAVVEYSIEGEWVSADGTASLRKFSDGRIIIIAEAASAVQDAVPAIGIDRKLLRDDGVVIRFRVYFGFADETAEKGGELMPLAERCLGLAFKQGTA